MDPNEPLNQPRRRPIVRCFSLAIGATAFALSVPAAIEGVFAALDLYSVSDATSVRFQSTVEIESIRSDSDLLYRALPLLEHATKLAPMSGEAHFDLGYVRLQRGEIDLAEDSFRAAAVILTSTATTSIALIAEARRKNATKRTR